MAVNKSTKLTFLVLRFRVRFHFPTFFCVFYRCILCIANFTLHFGQIITFQSLEVKKYLPFSTMCQAVNTRILIAIGRIGHHVVKNRHEGNTLIDIHIWRCPIKIVVINYVCLLPVDAKNISRGANGIWQADNKQSDKTPFSIQNYCNNRRLFLLISLQCSKDLWLQYWTLLTSLLIY